MIELISRKLANFLCKDDNEETFELYKYAVYIVLSSILHIVTIIILGVCFNLLIESILFYGSFISIRKFAGGYHAKTPTRCYIFSVISFLFVLLLIHIINNESCFSGYWWIIFEYLFVIVICKLSPLDTDNKLLNDKERMVYKGVTIVITNILELKYLDSLGVLPILDCDSYAFLSGDDIFKTKKVLNSHSGIDIVALDKERENNVIASKSGIVVFPSEDDRIDYHSYDKDASGYGNYVIIQHEDGNYTLYAHLKENTISVRAGQKVEQGQIIGKIGDSGNCISKHLHFELRYGENKAKYVANPEYYVSMDNPRIIKGESVLYNRDLEMKQKVMY